MSAWKIGLYVVLAIVAIPVLLTAWSYAGALVSTDDSAAVFAGVAIYAAIAGTIVAATVVGIRKLIKRSAA